MPLEALRQHPALLHALAAWVQREAPRRHGLVTRLDLGLDLSLDLGLDLGGSSSPQPSSGAATGGQQGERGDRRGGSQSERGSARPAAPASGAAPLSARGSGRSDSARSGGAAGAHERREARASLPLLTGVTGVTGVTGGVQSPPEIEGGASGDASGWADGRGSAHTIAQEKWRRDQHFMKADALPSPRDDGSMAEPRRRSLVQPAAMGHCDGSHYAAAAASQRGRAIAAKASKEKGGGATPWTAATVTRLSGAPSPRAASRY